MRWRAETELSERWRATPLSVTQHTSGAERVWGQSVAATAGVMIHRFEDLKQLYKEATAIRYVGGERPPTPRLTVRTKAIRATNTLPLRPRTKSFGRWKPGPDFTNPIRRRRVRRPRQPNPTRTLTSTWPRGTSRSCRTAACGQRMRLTRASRESHLANPPSILIGRTPATSKVSWFRVWLGGVVGW